MQMIEARNQQAAMPQLLGILNEGELRDDQLVVGHPVVFRFEAPREHLIFWPGIRRNPASELRNALLGLEAAQAAIPAAMEAVKKEMPHFLFSTLTMAVSASVTMDNRLHLSAVLSDPNPFLGAFGQSALQLSILQDLMAQVGKLGVGALTMQHQSLKLAAQFVGQLHSMALGHLRPENPYENGMKARRVDGPLDIKNLLDPKGRDAMGTKSKWARHVAVPVLNAVEAETIEEAIERCAKVKADDWRRSMTEWCEAVSAAKATDA